jgi:heat shock protein HtpX
VRRAPHGHDLGLTIRMAVALLPIALWYIGAGLLAVFFVIVGVYALATDRAFGAFFGALLFGVGIPAMLVVHVRQADRLALRTARARILKREEHADLQALVARVAGHADVPAPRVALVESASPNALSVGRSPERAVVALTTGLLRRLTRAELEAVVAHELAHVANRDGLVMTLVSVPALAGSAMWHSDDWRGKIVFVLYFPIWLVGLLLMWAISRYREYVADRTAALVTGAPEQLMSALTKIGGKEARGDLRGGVAIQALCIVPTKTTGWRRLEMLADHPPLEKRLERLEELSRKLGRAT